MERVEKVIHREGKKQELMGKKLKRVLLVGKKGGNCTPPPTWRLEFPSQDNNDSCNFSSTDPTQQFVTFPTTETSAVSARKLCANLWEILPHNYQHLPVAKMSKAAAAVVAACDDVSGRMSPQRNHMERKLDLPRHVVHPPDSTPDDKPATPSSLRRHVRASLTKNHVSAERNGHSQQLVSSTGYSSSMEVTPYKPTLAPAHALDFRGKIGESSYKRKTSAELLKVLNRTWSLEEEHATSIALVKGLKMELDCSQARIKELLRERQREKKEMDDLLKQVSDDKLERKSKEMEKLKYAVQSLRNELGDERKLRKHSESLHRKLARQLSDMRSSFSNAHVILEKEINARVLLENLCDEFAKGIRDYEQEVRSLRNTSENDQIGGENTDRLVLHISEAWLDERLQLRLAEARNDLVETSVLDKLSEDIKSFLRAKQSVDLGDKVSSSQNLQIERYWRRHSSESFPLNEAVSAPRVAAGEEDSLDSNTNNIGVKKYGRSSVLKTSSQQHDDSSWKDRIRDLATSLSVRKDNGLHDFTRRDNLLNVQLQSEEHTAEALSCEGKTIQFEDKEQIKMTEENEIVKNGSQKSETSRAFKDAIPGRKMDGVCLSQAGHVLDSLTGNNSSLPLEGYRHSLKTTAKEFSLAQSLNRGPSSPVQQWKSISAATGIGNVDSSTKCPQEPKEHTLKAKLIEARLASRRSRRKASRASI